MTYYGVLAPNSAWRSRIVPTPPGDPSAPVADTCLVTEPAQQAGARITTPPGHEQSAATRPDRLTLALQDPANADPLSGHRHRIPWADLLKRTFGADVLRCEQCGGRRKVIAFISQRNVAIPILLSLGLPHEPPRVAPAREPPQAELDFP